MFFFSLHQVEAAKLFNHGDHLNIADEKSKAQNTPVNILYFNEKFGSETFQGLH